MVRPRKRGQHFALTVSLKQISQNVHFKPKTFETCVTKYANDVAAGSLCSLSNTQKRLSEWTSQ